jgi:4-amino-4-deoxy-L-arabinose transferase-like glycosyltransferase
VLLEGPPTSVGGVHLGPAYYYLMALPMLVDWLDPLADAVLMALLGAAAVGIVFGLARRWFGGWPALAAAGLFAISPAAIVATRSAWNPAPAPFFAGLALLGLDCTWRSGNGRWLVLVGLALGILIQLHYFSLAFVVVSMAFSAFLVRMRPRLVGWAIAGLVVFVALLSPLLVSEVLHGFPNMRAAATLVGGGGGLAPVQGSVPRRIYEIFALGMVGMFLASKVEVVAAVVSVLLIGGLGYGFMSKRAPRFPTLLVACLLVATVAQAVVYRGQIFEHYFVPIALALDLAVAVLIGLLPQKTRLLGVLGVLALAGLNLLNSPLRAPPDNQLAHTRGVAELIAEAAAGEPFELWLLAGGEADGAYRFWLERMGRPALPPDAPLAPQLFIICRRPVCDVAHAQAAAGQPWSSARVAWQATVADDDILELVQVVQAG